MDTRSVFLPASKRQPRSGSDTASQNQSPKPTPKQESSSKETQPRRNPKSYFPDYLKPTPEETIYSWSAPSRPFKKHNRQYYTNIATIVLLLCLLLFFAGQFLPIAVVIAVGFLAYVLSTVEPQNINIEISTFGLRVEEELYYWDEIGRFWYSEKYKQRIVNFEVARLPFRLSVLLGETSEKELTEILSEILLKQKPTLTFYEKGANWLQKKIPLDIDS